MWIFNDACDMAFLRAKTFFFESLKLAKQAKLPAVLYKIQREFCKLKLIRTRSEFPLKLQGKIASRLVVFTFFILLGYPANCREFKKVNCYE